MNLTGTVTVVDKNGLRGTIEDGAAAMEQAHEVVVVTEDGQQVLVRSDWLQRQGDGTYYLPVSLSQVESVLPVIQEELRVHKRQVQTGGVRIRKNVHRREQVVDEPGFREEVEVERVPVNRVLEAPVAVRQEGETLIVPLLEEILVVEKRLILKEEIRITKRRHEIRTPQQVTLRSEDVSIERLDAQETQPEETSDQ
jgi:uncharacterized protein (TIGR02271 family)